MYREWLETKQKTHQNGFYVAHIFRGVWSVVAVLHQSGRTNTAVGDKLKISKKKATRIRRGGMICGFRRYIRILYIVHRGILYYIYEPRRRSHSSLDAVGRRWIRRGLT